MTNKVTKNYLYNLSFQLLVIIVPLITTPYISRVLGAEGIGIYSYTYSIITYFTLVAAMGSTTYAQREIAYHQDDAKYQSVFFWEIVILRISMAFICGIVYFEYVSYTKYWNIALVQSLYLVGTATDISWYFQGREEFKKTVTRNIIIKLINVAFIFVFVREADDLIAYVLGLAFLPVVGNLSLWLYLPQSLKKVCVYELKPLRHLKDIFQLFIPTIAIQIYTVFDKTMIGVFADTPVENGYYEQAEKLVKVCLTVITAFGTTLMPRISSTYAQGDFKALKHYIRQSYHFVWFLGVPIFFGMIGISEIIVPWFFGMGYEKVEILLCIFSVLILAIGLNNVTGVQYLVSIRKQNVFTLTVIFGAVVNVFMNILLIPRFFAIGAAISSITAESLITIVQFVYVIYIERSFSASDIFSRMYKCWISGAIMFGAIVLLKAYVKATFISTVFLVAFGAALYIIMLLILKDEFVLTAKEKVMSKLRRS